MKGFNGHVLLLTLVYVEGRETYVGRVIQVIGKLLL